MSETPPPGSISHTDLANELYPTGPVRNKSARLRKRVGDRKDLYKQQGNGLFDVDLYVRDAKNRHIRYYTVEQAEAIRQNLKRGPRPSAS